MAGPVVAYQRPRSQNLHDRYEHTTHQVIALLVSARQGDKRSLSEPAVLALQKHWLQLPTTAWSPSPMGGGPFPPTSPLGAKRFSQRPSNGLRFNPHRSRSGSVQRILSVVPAERILSICGALASGHHR